MHVDARGECYIEASHLQQVIYQGTGLHARASGACSNKYTRSGADLHTHIHAGIEKCRRCKRKGTHFDIFTIMLAESHTRYGSGNGVWAHD